MYLRYYIRYRLSMRGYFLLLGLQVGLVLAGAEVLQEASHTDQPSNPIVAVRDGNLDVNSSVDSEVQIDGVPVVSA